MGKMKASAENAETARAAVLTPADEAGVVLFGTDESGKAHASRFPIAELELVERAAGLMGFRVLKVATPEMRATALELPVGRIFGATGKAFVPFVKTAAHEALCGFEGAYAPTAPTEPDDGASLPFADVSQTWASITAGSLVLAMCNDGSGAWYEAVVTELSPMKCSLASGGSGLTTAPSFAGRTRWPCFPPPHEAKAPVCEASWKACIGRAGTHAPDRHP